MAAAGEGPLTAAFSAEEQSMYDQLHSKYSKGPLPLTAAQAQAPVQPIAAASALAQPGGYRLCAECQGKGSVAEVYNNRTLERSCTQCSGQGTKRTEGGSGGGTTHSSSGKVGSTHISSGSGGIQGGTFGTVPSRSGSRSERERLAGWEAELEALKQSLAGVSDSQELQLKAALILELERAAARLRKRLSAAKQGDQLLPAPSLAD